MSQRLLAPASVSIGSTVVFQDGTSGVVDAGGGLTAQNVNIQGLLNAGWNYDAQDNSTTSSAASKADSTATASSVATSKANSLMVPESVAASKGDSGGTAASVASSQATTVSTNTSTLTSRRASSNK